MPKIDWLNGKPREAIVEYLAWRKAVEAADEGNLKPLIQLFRSERQLGPDARELIADLLERHNLRRLPNRPPTPAYKITETEAHIDDFCKLYRYNRKHGLTKDEAIESAWHEKEEDINSLAKKGFVLSKEGLIAAIEGKRGSTRRVTTRRRKRASPRRM